MSVGGTHSHQGFIPINTTDFSLYSFSVADPPSDGGDSDRPEEDTFGVSFLLNDVDETAGKDGAPGISRELLCVST